MFRSAQPCGAALLAAVVLLGLTLTTPWTALAQTCAPAISTSSTPIRQADGTITALDIETRATATTPGGDRLTSVTFSRAANATVQIDGRVRELPTTVTLPSAMTWTFRANRINPEQPFRVDYVVRDLCGDTPRFIGAGTGSDDQEPAAPTPAPTISPTTTTPPTVTMPAPIATPPSTPTAATPSPTSVAEPSATPPAAPPDPAGKIKPAALKLTATFNSVGVEAPFTGDPNGNAVAALAFRRAGESAWRAGLDLWQTADASGSAFYGSALLLDAGAEYQIRVTITDPDGVDGETVQTASVSTRAETITPASNLTPNYFVRAKGSDAADGRSAATAWRTIDKAIKDAPGGAVVQVGPGHYPTQRAQIGGWTYARTLPLTLVAQYPAVNADRRPSNIGSRSVIEPVGLSSPSGATDGPNPGVWRRLSLTGPKTGAPYTVWAWTGGPVTDATQLGYATSRAASPIRLAHWKKDSQDLATPAGWAEKLHTNQTYSYGFYASGPDIYVRLPGDLDPNTLYLTASNKSHTALAIHGPDIRISGFEIRQFASGVEVMWNARRAVVERNLITGNLTGVFFRAQGSTYGSDHVVQDNIVQDTSLWSVDPAAPAIPWMFVKDTVINADGSAYATRKVGANAESAGVTGRGAAQRLVIRRNLFSGLFDGVRNGYNDGFDRYAGQDMDIHDNVIRQIADDALEPEQAAINFRAWNNHFEQTLTVLSTGPVKWGPVYLFRNTAWRTGAAGVGADGQGRLPSSAMLKYSGTSTPAARIYVLHNTFWTDRPNVSGGAQMASYGANAERFWIRNTLIRATVYAFDAPSNGIAWDENGNHFSTTHTSRGLRYSGTIYAANVQAYRDASGRGVRTNVSAGFTSDVSVVNGPGGDLRLPSGSPLVDGGVLVPNLSDRSGADFQGAAPDIGADLR